MKNNPLKNPAVKSMLSIAFYLVVIIVIWIAIGTFLFPDSDETVSTDYESIVTANEPLITQLAQNASDETVLEALRATDEVTELLESLNVTDIEATDDGAAFIIESDEYDENITVRLLYYAEGSYIFSPEDPDEWSSSTEEDTGSLRWDSTSGAYVTVSRLADQFFLEESYDPAA